MINIFYMVKDKLIKVGNDYFLVNKSTIEVDDYYLAWENNYSTPKWILYNLSSGLNGENQYKVIGSTIPDIGEHRLNKSNCDEIYNGYDLEDLASEWVFVTNKDKWSNNDDTAGDNYGSFKAGFNMCLNLLGKKQFDHNELKVIAWELLRDNPNVHSFSSFEEVFEEYIAEYNTIEVEIVIVNYVDMPSEQPFTADSRHTLAKHVTNTGIPVIEDGCIILMKI